jgi:hypothetical protein
MKNILDGCSNLFISLRCGHNIETWSRAGVGQCQLLRRPKNKADFRPWNAHFGAKNTTLRPQKGLFIT